MEKFSLDKWLKDKSRKVVTRDGRPVRIICTDRKGKTGNIVGLVDENESFIYVWNNDGKHIVSEVLDNDLFFADEEEELTEFEKELVDLVSSWCDSHIETPEEYINKHSQNLLDLARKEILKDFPKWKKAKEDRVLEDWVVKFNKDGKIIFSDVVYKGEYFIILQSLETLPKE